MHASAHAKTKGRDCHGPASPHAADETDVALIASMASAFSLYSALVEGDIQALNRWAGFDPTQAAACA